MIVIGVNPLYYHDNSVSVIIDGNLAFAAEEERFTRIKHAPRQLPYNALKAAFRFLKSRGYSVKDVDAYAINWDIGKFLLKDKIRATATYSVLLSSLNLPEWIPEKIDLNAKLLFQVLSGSTVALIEKLINYAIKGIGESPPSRLRIFEVEHHLAHAASAYYFSGFESSAVLSIDGAGERESAATWVFKNGEADRLATLPINKGSLGYLWEYVSLNLGYEANEGPGKLMGLAPYGDEGLAKEIEKKIEDGIKLDSGDFPFEFKDGFKSKGIFSNNLEGIKAFADYIVDGQVRWNPRGEIDKKAASVALALQNFTNKLFVHLGRWIKERTGEDRIALAGGVALNARANMELYYSKIFNDMFIFPAANDAGGAAGAAAYVYEHVLGGKMKRERLQHVYLGPEYSDDDVKKAVEKSKLKAEYIGDDVAQVADLVAKGKIVTWYQGRAELGPRALGHRSILADPTRKEYWRLVNDIKGREWWRPLAPSLLLEDAGEYFVNPTHHPFMILMFRFKDKEACERVPVVCHVDMTSRPQTVTGQEDRNWYNVIKAFKEIKGEGLVMNTSFNLAGEPLVETPQDAIRSFALGGFDAMYMQGWLISKG